MNQKEVLEFDGFRVERESFLGGDCYGVVTSCKKDEKGVSYHLEVEFDISTAKFHFSKCYAHEVVPCQELSAGGKLKVMTYLIEKAASAYVTEKAAVQKMSLEKLKVLYREDEVVMREILASEKPDGLTIEESFYLYILAQNWANGDEFSWACGGVEEEWVSLVEEARKMKISCLSLEKKSYVLVGFLFAFDVVLSLWGFDPLVKFSASSAMYIIVDSYMFRTDEVVCIYVSKISGC